MVVSFTILTNNQQPTTNNFLNKEAALKALLARRIPFAYFLLLCIVTAAVAVGWLALTHGSAPTNAVLIDEPGTPAPVATQAITPTLSPPTQQVAQQTESPMTPTAVLSSVTVYVTGAVAKPGVYTLPAGSRESDAVAAAGGLVAGADPEAINMAEHISDEQHISVPIKGAINAGATAISATTATPAPVKAGATKTGSTAQPMAPAQKVNINTATVPELEALPGIGTVLAGRIVVEREAHGPYKSLDDLARVAGIKDTLITKLRDLITVGP